ncbi:MAG TPA: hypothetical protein DEP66_01190, partial [Acidimicrobiaceae bacterium]|nr:hypothetical protein [Acidimicrobiaceae bacterium]
MCRSARPRPSTPMTETAPDTIGMRRALLGLGDQLERAAASEPERELPAGASFANVVLAGMGGSGIAGDIAVAVAGPDCPVPMTVVKGYECPAFVGPGTLAAVLSFSGNTEETLSVAQAAHAAGATVVAVTSGGTLAELAEQWGAPVYRVDASIPMPRAAVGAMAVPPLLALRAAGLAGDVEEQVAGAVAQVRARLAGSAAGADGAAFVVCGAGDLGTAAALRWKTQLNENTKVPAAVGALPELCHNELAGWQVSLEHARRVRMFFLRHDFEHEQNKRRFEYYAQVLADAGVPAP